jgi:hypothetical protein
MDHRSALVLQPLAKAGEGDEGHDYDHDFHFAFLRHLHENLVRSELVSWGKAGNSVREGNGSRTCADSVWIG